MSVGRISHRERHSTVETAEEDAKLVEACRQGQPQAFELLFERYRRPVYAYFNRMCAGDRMTADDLFQELWLRVSRKLGDYREQGRFGAWLFQIAANLWRGDRRGKIRRSRWETTSPDGELPDCPVASGAADELTRTEQRMRLEAGIRLLPEEQREVFHFRQAGVSFREIAVLQSCPINTALGRMRLALKSLKEFCHEHENDL